MKTAFQNLRRVHPLIHSITNYVTANDCANILLACGASPIMADDPEEAPQITALCAGLNLNMGTISASRFAAMRSAGQTANELAHPVVLDPVGVGASQMRMRFAGELLEAVRFSVIRGNFSEIRALATGCGGEKGVDTDGKAQVTEESLSDAVDFARSFSQKTGAVVAMTGAIDLVADENTAYCIRGGHPMMASVTGAGCMLSALTAAFAAANPGRILEACAAAVCAMDLAGETAARRMGPLDGNATYRNYLIDAIYHMTPEELEGANYEVRT